MLQILFVINPNAGKPGIADFERALSDECARLALAGQQARVETLIPETPEQMREVLRKRFEKEPVDILGVVGGDGSVMEVLPVLVQYPKMRLALIPYGTGNLLAANLGIPTDLPAALRLLFEGEVRRIDVGKIGAHYFALLAGIGTVADIMENTESRHKHWLGLWAYLVDGVRTIMRARHGKIKITADGRTIKARGVSVVVSNAASLMKPCLPLTPEAEPDDGLLDVCLIRARSRRDYIPVILELLRRNRTPCSDRKVTYLRTRKLRVESSPALKVQADGNIIGMTPVDIELLHNRLQIIVPEASLRQGADESMDRIRTSHAMEDILGRLFSQSGVK